MTVFSQPPQLGLKTNPPPIQEKPQKTNKKPPPAREELLKMTVSRTKCIFTNRFTFYIFSDQTVRSSFLSHASILQEAIMTEYLNSKNLTEAVSGVREMRAPKHFLPEMLSKIIVCSLDRPDEDKEHASTLIHTLRTEGLITGENFMQVYTVITLELD